MKSRVALIAPGAWKLDSIRAHLASRKDWETQEFHSLSQIETGLRRGLIDALITRLQHFSGVQASQIGKIRRAFPDLALATIAETIDPSARYAIRHLERHVLIDEQLELVDLPLALEKLMQEKNEKDYPRLHPRTNRRDVVVVQSEDGDWSAQARFVDFAQMGARIEFSDVEFELKPKTRIHLEYRSSHDPSRKHRILAHAVWTRSMRSQSGSSMGKLKFWSQPAGTLLGVRFIATL